MRFRFTGEHSLGDSSGTATHRLNGLYDPQFHRTVAVLDSESVLCGVDSEVSYGIAEP